MRISAKGLTDVGQKRANNQDYFLVAADQQLFGVADGMGGHRGGGVASELAVDVIHTYVQSHEREDAETALTDAIQEASRQIFERAQQTEDLTGMGTTATFAWVKGNTIYIAHVGDSRAYLLRDGKIWQLTEDHSLVHEQVKAGLLPEDAERDHLLKNVLTRSVGFEPQVKVDVYQKELESGDTYLLSSDGLNSMVKDEEISRIIFENDANHALKKLIDKANENGGDDNITSVLIWVEE